MMRMKWVAGVAGVLLLAAPGWARMKDIRVEKLPKDVSVQNAYRDVAAVESYVLNWSDTWRHEVPKAKMVLTLDVSLRKLEVASAKQPDNLELNLLTGLVARYAYNVDVKGSHEAAEKYLGRAQQLAPEDYRAAWFLGVHQCQLGGVRAGMGKLLLVEKTHDRDTLADAFWDDYIECGSMASMPAHVMRAGSYLAGRKAGVSASTEFLVKAARGRHKKADVEVSYATNEVWSSKRNEERLVFTNTLFGVSFEIPGTWRLDLPTMKGSVPNTFTTWTGPYTGKEDETLPWISVLVYRAKAGDTLEGLARSAMAGNETTTGVLVYCPSRSCMTMEARKAGQFGAEGDALILVTGFEREQPEYPGLLFEEPSELPGMSGEGRGTFLVPIERFGRLEGKIYYLVFLVTPSGVVEKAKTDYETFLRGMRVE